MPWALPSPAPSSAAETAARPGVRLSTSFMTTEAPRLTQLLILQGFENQPLINTTLEGLVFKQSQWLTPADGNFTPQGEMNIPAAVEFVCARNIAVRRCAFTQLGGYTLAFDTTGHTPPWLLGARGFWTASTIGLVLAALGLCALLWWVLRRQLRRESPAAATARE